MESKNQPDQCDHRTEKNVAPETDKRASDDRSPTKASGQNDQGLQAKNVVITESRAERWGFWTLLATVALAIGTFVLAVATADMARTTRTLADLAGQQAHDTQAALGIAARQAAAAEEANRIALEPSLSITNLALPAPQPNQKLTASYAVFDSGRTAAFNVQAQGSLIVLPAPQFPPSIPQMMGAKGGTILYPASGMQNTGLTHSDAIESSTLTKTVVDDVIAGRSVLYHTLRVDFEDAKGNPHHISMCNMYIVALGGPGPCSGGNDSR